MEATPCALIDSHLHLDMGDFAEDRDAVIRRALAQGVRQMISIGCGSASCRAAIAIAQSHPQVFATAGVHPHQASTATAEELQQIEELLEHPRVVGVGETGLDYYYMHSPKEQQLASFRAHTRLAISKDLPLIIHTRDAEEDTIELLEEERDNQPIRGVIHCFSGTYLLAQRCLEMGFYLSIPGIVTFSSSLKKVVKKLPLDRLLIETDSPYLAPKPHRGKRNEPAFVVETAKALAKLLKRPFEEVAAATTRNTQSLFGLPPLED